MRQNRELMAGKIVRIINAPGGKTVEDREEILAIIEGLLPEQLAQLRAALSDYNELRRLRFRGDPLPGAPGREGESEGEPGEEPAV